MAKPPPVRAQTKSRSPSLSRSPVAGASLVSAGSPSVTARRESAGAVADEDPELTRTCRWHGSNDEIVEPVAVEVADFYDSRRVGHRNRSCRLETAGAVSKDDRSPTLSVCTARSGLLSLLKSSTMTARGRRRRADGRCRLERAVPVAEKDHDERAGAVAGEHQVDVAVAVEIRRHDVLRRVRQGDDGRRAEFPEAVAEEHPRLRHFCDMMTTIQVAVVVEVGHSAVVGRAGNRDEPTARRILPCRCRAGCRPC